MKTRWIAVLLAGVLAAGASEASAGKPAEPDEVALVRGNNEFAFDLYARLRATDGNVFFSPYSISSALAMTQAGARGPTARQMSGTLRFPTDGDRLHRAFATVARDVIGGARGGVELHIANGLWTQTGLPILPAFQATVTNLYRAEVTPLDFMRAPETARMRINAWVEQQTRDRIKDLVPEDVIKPDARVVLTNAIYFKGAWQYAFPEAGTRNGPFTLATGAAVGDVPLMNQRGRFRYLDGGTFQALELPYDAGAQSMIVFLPARADGLPELEKTLTAAHMTDYLARMTLDDVSVTLPRFKLTAAFQLKDALVALGMPLAFSAAKADFSGITTAQRLALSAVIHKAYVDVNEKGTEAAAATAAVLVTTSAGPRESSRVFRADHPFLIVIRDNRTGSLLFAGRLVHPQAR
jgi:serpin B